MTHTFLMNLIKICCFVGNRQTVFDEMIKERDRHSSTQSRRLPWKPNELWQFQNKHTRTGVVKSTCFLMKTIYREKIKNSVESRSIRRGRMDRIFEIYMFSDENNVS